MKTAAHTTSLFVLAAGIVFSYAEPGLRSGSSQTISSVTTQKKPVLAQLNLLVPDLPEPMVITLSGVAMLVTSFRLLRKRS